MLTVRTRTRTRTRQEQGRGIQQQEVVCQRPSWLHVLAMKACYRQVAAWEDHQRKMWVPRERVHRERRALRQPSSLRVLPRPPPLAVAGDGLFRQVRCGRISKKIPGSKVVNTYALSASRAAFSAASFSRRSASAFSLAARSASSLSASSLSSRSRSSRSRFSLAIRSLISWTRLAFFCSNSFCAILLRFSNSALRDCLTSLTNFW